GSILLDKHFRSVAQGAKSLEGVTVIWCAAINDEEARIVGWYRNATVYREMVSLPLYEEEYIHFNFMADAKDCYLLPEEKRSFAIKRSKSSAPQKGASKSNIWYAKSEYGRKEFIPRVEQFIEDYNGGFVPFQIRKNLSDALPQVEDGSESYENYMEKAQYFYDEGDYRNAVIFYNGALKLDRTYDAGLGLANAYYQLNAFRSSLSIVENLIEKHGENIDLIELAFIASEFMMDKEKAPLYFRKLSELEGKTLSDAEYYEYLNEITDLHKTYGQYL
ncbi:MAG TPA: hypothetical protein DHM90_09480, partial [Clostridiaceae bacterium]|nr:hypothetical protein [Clostridiaceae bacterium]